MHAKWAEASQACVYVCVCECVRIVPLGETIANSRKWIGMEGLARDSGVKMKEFFHTCSNSLPLSFCLFLSLSLFLSLPPPLCLLQDGLFIFATWVLTRVHMQIQSRTCINTHPHMQIFEQHLTILIQFKSTY